MQAIDLAINGMSPIDDARRALTINDFQGTLGPHMEKLLEQLCTTPLSRDIGPLRALIAQLRPKRANDVAEATRNLQALIYLLTSKPRYASALREYFDKDLDQSLADA